MLTLAYVYHAILIQLSNTRISDNVTVLVAHIQQESLSFFGASWKDYSLIS